MGNSSQKSKSIPKISYEIPQNGSQQRRRSYKKVFWWVNPQSNTWIICKENYMKQLNGYQETEKHQKSNETQNCTKTAQNSSPGESDSCVTILWTWATRVTPFKGPYKVFKQVIALL